MKTNLLKSAVLAASLLGALSPASAETLHARIPFGFSAAGATLPAGAYVIRTMPNTPHVLLFENEETKVQTMVFARAAAEASLKPVVPLTFIAYSSERMELAYIATDGSTYELNAHPDGKALNAVAFTLTSGGK